MAGKRDKAVAAEPPDTIEATGTAVVRLEGEPPRRNSLTIEQWAKRINSRWQDSVQGILGAAAFVLQAHHEHPGNWARLVSRLIFGDKTAIRLRKIARHSVLMDGAHAHLLPPSWMTIYELSKLKPPELLAAIEDGLIRPDMERSHAIALRRKPKDDAITAVPRLGRYHLLHAAVDQLDDIDDDSVDLILTDPPYPREYLPVYGQLAETAARVLKPGGSCFAMVGQSYLPTIIAAMSRHLAYHWTLAYLTPGGQAVQLWDRGVNTFWKPVLWFVKGEHEGKWLGDVARSDANDNDKRFHHWGQSESGMLDLVERVSEPGETILDPFCGGGATGVASVALGRLFIGSDIDAAHLETSRQRLARIVEEGHADAA